MVDVDRDIIEAIRKGKVRRFGELVDRHKEKAMTLAMRIVGEKWQAEELVQDAFLRAYRGLDTFRGEARFSTWFYTILHNVCMTKAVRRPEGDRHLEAMGDDMSENGLPVSPDASAHEQLENEETKTILHEEMRRLPEKFRIALTLFYVQELSYEEMALVLQMPIGTVKTNLSRGRVVMRRRVLQRMKDEVHAR